MLDDGGLARLAGGRQAIGEEQHVRRPLAVGEHAQGTLERAVDIGAAAGVKTFDKTDRRGAGFIVEFFELRPERFNLAVVGDDVEQVAFAQVVEHELGRALGLLDFLAAHAAGAIDDKHNRFRHPLIVGRFHLGAGEQQKIAVLVRLWPITDRARADFPFAAVVEQAKVLARHQVLGFILDDGMLLSGRSIFTSCVAEYTFLIGVPLSIATRMPSFSSGSHVYLAVLSGKIKSVRP